MALAWLFRSNSACGGKGSAHSYSVVWGWSKPYPETTGYLIPSLLAWARLRRDEALFLLARRFGRWLVELQQPEGFWTGGMVGGNRPSVFNTAMIADGLSALAAHLTDEATAGASAHRGLAWLLSRLEPDGAWRHGLYVSDFVPVYHAYAVSAALRTAERLQQPEGREPLQRALHYYAGFFRPDGTLANAGLKPGPWAFTHTIAYALHGLWDAAQYFQEKTIQQQVLTSCRSLQGIIAQQGRIAGRYREGWTGDYSFTSPVGNAQLSCLFRAIGNDVSDPAFDQWADWTLDRAIEHQCQGSHPGTRGALPGSVPGWGPYLRGRYPNWGVKFLLDALYAARAAV